MKNNKVRFVDLDFIKSTFKKKITLLIFFSTVIAFSVVYVFLFNVEDIKIYPGKEFYYGAYNDEAVNGKSEILFCDINDTLIHLDFLLKEGFVNPYVGISIQPKSKKLVDLGIRNKLQLSVEGQNHNKIGLLILKEYPKLKEEQACYYFSLPLIDNKQIYIVDVKEFKIPDWWLIQKELNLDEVANEHLKNFTTLNINSDYSHTLNMKKTIEINSIVFYRDNSFVFVVFAIIIFLELLSIFILNVLKLKREKSKVVINYRAIDLNQVNLGYEGFIQYINNNYHNNSLTLEMVSRYAGISPRQIAASILKEFGCNFKSYVNNIRINESKRLLIDSKLNIGEIAYKIGFNNQSHFNRVFKQSEGVTPSEFRQQNC